MTEHRVHTFCRLCEPACGLVATVRNGAVGNLQTDPDHPIHKGFSCHKGVHFLEIHRDPDRLDRPLRRVNPRSEEVGEFVAVDWDDAVRDIADRLRDIRQRHGRNALAVYQGNPSAFNGTYYANAAALARGFDTRMRFSAGTQDTSAKYAASEAIYGASMAHPIPDLLHTDYFLCLGSNPLVSHMTLMHISNPMAKIRAIKKRGGKTLFVNPRRIESSGPDTGEVLLIKPDSDFYFLAAILHEIVFRIGYDRAEVEKHARNIDDLVEFVGRYSAEHVSAATGIAADDIRQVADDFCAAPTAGIYMATGVNQGRQGALAYWMLNMISLFSGNLGRRGGNIYSRGMSDVVQNSKRKREDPFFEGSLGEVRTVSGDLPAARLAEYIENEKDPIRALIVISGNPLLSVSGEERMRAAMAGMELIVTIDLYRTVTGEISDYVLPATDWLEHEDVNFLNTMGVAMEPYVQYTPAVVPPKGDRRDDWWILARIQQEMGVRTLLDDPEPAPLANADAAMREAGLSIERLKQLPCQTAVLPEAVPSHVFTIAVQHDDGLIDCCPPVFRRAYRTAEDILDELSGESADQLKLITRRTHYMLNSWLHNSSVLKQSLHQDNPLWMHPDDATRRDLAEGDEVRVSNRYGSVDATLAFDEGLKPGVVAMTHGWGQKTARSLRTASRHPGTNVNRLSPVGEAGYDILSNQSHLTGINVEVTRRAHPFT
ncbi:MULTISPECIES: molybdopterin-dependent oxidoreductase [Rhodococcus]|uniref:molybdopterin-containing oxidoreductase family protein n=1 Tax=Rhodococcus TaxID=1827 RepID=UPI000376FC49|nr:MULTISPECIES: molybdopterin-dependent oxidoreductase [Rhodococcus]QHG81900.1 formate dehydrogenase [Rhodococcus rhodochrous]QOH58424.1 formate dehydrogenase [Rhodococcus rhodochrous]WAL46053.1 molybdopterin-dependent oxidoreductase [Rhodococcus pyridinivorans]